MTTTANELEGVGKLMAKPTPVQAPPIKPNGDTKTISMSTQGLQTWNYRMSLTAVGRRIADVLATVFGSTTFRRAQFSSVNPV